MIISPYIALLSSVVTEAAGSDKPIVHHFLKNDLASECRFDLGDWTYDLCPLVLDRNLKEVDGGSKIKEEGRGRWRWSERRYSFSFLAANANPKCPRGTWVCMQETHGSDHFRPEEPAVTHHVPIAGPSFSGISTAQQAPSTSNQAATLQDGLGTQQAQAPLHLLMNDPSHAEIEFECAADYEDSDLTFLGESDGVHRFRWRSRHSCPRSRSADSESILTTLEEDADGENSDEAKNEDGTDLVSPPPYRKLRPWMAITLFVAVIMLAFVIIFNTSPHARTTVRSQLSSISEGIINRLPGIENKVRFAISYLTIPHPLFRRLRWKISGLIRSYSPVSWRANESTLVRWAHEDLLIEGEGDMMVNGSAAFAGRDVADWDNLEMEEYIPLKSAKEVEAAKDYGTRGRSVRFW